MKRVFSLVLTALFILSLCSCAKEPADGGKDAGSVSDNTGSDIGGDLKTLTQSHDGYNVSREDSEKLFEVINEYAIDCIPRLGDEKPMLLDMAYYASSIHEQYFKKKYENGNAYIEGKDVETVANEHFGVSYGLTDKDVINFPVGEGRIPGVNDIVRYEAVDADGEKRVTIVGRSINVLGVFYMSDAERKRYMKELYHFDPNDDNKTDVIALNDFMVKNDIDDPYAAIKEIIFSGKGDMLYTNEGVGFRISYTSDDGYTPKKFISYDRYSEGY